MTTAITANEAGEITGIVVDDGDPERRPYVGWRNEGTDTILAGTFDHDRLMRVLHENRCGWCGHGLGYRYALVGGPKAVENRLFGRPPLHPECIEAALATEMFEDPELIAVIVRKYEIEWLKMPEGHPTRPVVRGAKPVHQYVVRERPPEPEASSEGTVEQGAGQEA